MKRVLVPTDFSSCADNAIHFAVESARIVPLEITLLHSFEIISNVYTDYVGVNKEFNTTLLNEANSKLAALKEEIEQKHGVAVDVIISTESLQEAISTTLQNGKFDAIVMGTLGASGIKEKLWGSRTSNTISKSHIPVFAIPNDYKWKKPEKILLATNQFEKDPVILDFIFELAGLYMANVEVAIFTDKEDDNAGTFLHNNRQIVQYEKYLKETYKEETLTSAHLSGEDFGQTLQDFIAKNNIDILVMVTYPVKFWNRIFKPSKTKRMSYHTKIPLLAIPAGLLRQKQL
jgi:nucleotide-binding universal stress UspA family protein